jgi:hypothetical protein
MPVICVCGLEMKSYHGLLRHENYCSIFQDRYTTEPAPEEDQGREDGPSLATSDTVGMGGEDLERSYHEYQKYHVKRSANQ